MFNRFIKASKQRSWSRTEALHHVKKCLQSTILMHGISRMVQIIDRLSGQKWRLLVNANFFLICPSKKEKLRKP